MRPVVLVAEDDELIAALIAESLRDAGHEVVLAGDGTEAIRLARSLQPRLVVLDLGLPGQRGHEVLRALRALPVPPRVLVLTALARAEVEDEIRDLGADDFMTKPFSPFDLASRAGRLLVEDSTTREGRLTDRVA